MLTSTPYHLLISYSRQRITPAASSSITGGAAIATAGTQRRLLSKPRNTYAHSRKSCPPRRLRQYHSLVHSFGGTVATASFAKSAYSSWPWIFSQSTNAGVGSIMSTTTTNGGGSTGTAGTGTGTGRRRMVTRTRSSGSFGSLVGGSPRRLRKNASGSTSVSEVEKPTTLTIDDTPLGPSRPGSALLDGLDVYTVPSTTTDRHPLTVYGISSRDVRPIPHDRHGDHCRRPILLLHGRTWSSVPVYHLLGGPRRRDAHLESRSLMEALLATGDMQPYAMDFRGFGGTPPDSTGTVQPHVCVGDVEAVLEWIADRHGIFLEGDSRAGAAGRPCSDEEATSADDYILDGGIAEGEVEVEYCSKCELPALLGWSQGALVAQLAAQKSPHLISKLVLYGSIYDPLVRYPRRPLYTAGGLIANLPSSTDGSNSNDNGTGGGEKDREPPRVRNDHDGAIEDFTIEGTIEPEPAKRFAEAALESDPFKARWAGLHEFNNVDPARVHVPTLVVAGDQDPYCPLRAQQELFANLGRGADRSWSILSDADHAVHLLDGRDRFVKVVRSFVENTKMKEEED